MRWLLMAATLAGLIFARSSVAEPHAADSTAPSTAHRANTPQSATGHVTGVVVYEADKKRPWRLGRYYIRNRKTGRLAEAMVALDSPALKPTRRDAEPQTITIDQKDFRFVPETVAIRTGDQVTFTNSDAALHNVNAFHLHHQFNVNTPPGRRATRTFDRAVAVRRPVVLGCVYHSAMQAWIFVFDHRFYQLTAEDGRFRIENVPVGAYTLQMHHPAGRLWWQHEITVEAGRTTEVEIRVSPDHKMKTRATRGKPGAEPKR